jgi:ornithine cyclodeaminase/alanine dehydrogenase-like protein (mu-crystallin family)
VSGGAAPFRILTASDLEALLPPDVCIAAVESAMRATSRREVVLPLRTSTDVPGTTGRLILMPGVLASTESASPDTAAHVFGVKVVAKYARPPGDPLGTHVGTVLLLDADRGCLLAMLEGGTLTALRTAAASALATRTLAREDAAVLAVLGTGEEARRHVVALGAVRAFREVRIWGRTPAHADALVARLGPQLGAGVRLHRVESARDAVRGADVVCTTTSAREPILEGEWLSPGTHVNLVGSAVASTTEVDVECVRRARVYVDYRPSADAEAGELRRALAAGAIGSDHVIGEIGDVLIGRVPGRRTPEEVTLYKSLGIAAQDLAAAAWALAAAERSGRGLVVDLGA